MKKRVFTLLVAVMMLFVAVACQSQPEAPAVEGAQEPAAADKAPETKNTIAVVPKEEADQWFKHMAENGVDVYAADTGHNAYNVGPSSLDASLQVQIITDLIAQSVDAICVVPIDPDALTEVCNTARDNGITVIAHEAEEMSSADFDIEPCSGADYGAAMMDALAASMNYEGTYVCCVGQLTTVSHMLWMESAIARAEEKYPNMKLATAGIYESGDNQEKAYESTKELLKSDTEITGILYCADVAGIGGVIAIDEMGLSDKIHVVATGMPSISGQYVESGLMDAICGWDPAKTAYAMCELATFILENGVDAVGTEFNCEAEGYETITRAEDSNTFYGNAALTWTAENINDADRYF